MSQEIWHPLKCIEKKLHALFFQQIFLDPLKNAQGQYIELKMSAPLATMAEMKKWSSEIRIFFSRWDLNPRPSGS